MTDNMGNENFEIFKFGMSERNVCRVAQFLSKCVVEKVLLIFQAS